MRSGRRGLAALWLIAIGFTTGAALPAQPTHAVAQGMVPIKERHMDASRGRATSLPRSEDDQAMVDGWPLYRTERGQAAFNAAMATLAATDGNAPGAPQFKGCRDLACPLALPSIGSGGWLPPGRLWVSPNEFVLIAHSPRQREGRGWRRHMTRSMRYFVFHEFHNSSRNTDTFDTISSHSGSVFVPFYMSKTRTDARGRRFAIVVQVAPYDVSSIHASNYGSAGPGIEIALNTTDEAEPLQKLAGILVAQMVTAAAPHLRVVNHRGREGLAFLDAWRRRLAGLRGRSAAMQVALPYVPAPPQRLQSAAASFGQLMLRRGQSPPLAIAARTFVPIGDSKDGAARRGAAAEPVLIREGSMALGRPGEAEPQLVEPVRLVRGQ